MRFVEQKLSIKTFETITAVKERSDEPAKLKYSNTCMCSDTQTQEG